MKMKNRVLAVLALALLMINMMPVMRAEAAEGIDAPNIFDIDWGEYQDDVEAAVANNSYILVSYESGTYHYYLSNTPLSCIKGSGYYYIRYSNCVRCIYRTDGWVNFESPYTNNAILNSPSSDVIFVIGSNFDYRGSYASEMTAYSHSNMDYPVMIQPDPLVLPVTEPDYEYWLYHKTTSGEYMYWSKKPFDLEVSEGKYILNLSTGDIVYRLHLDPSHTYYRQVLSGSMQYVISSGDIFRSGQELVIDDVIINAWTEGDVTSEEVAAPQYSIPHITNFADRVRGVRSKGDAPREYFFAIDLHLSGEFDAAVTEKKILIDGNYLLPTEEYFRFCEVNDYEPSTTSFMSYVKQGVEEYYITVNWSHIETIVNRSDVVSDYMFRLTYSNAVDALIERGEFDTLYSQSVQDAFGDDIRRLCCPYRLACTLIGVVDGEYYYGDTYITVLYSELDSKTEDVAGVYSDYVSLDSNQRADAIESTINAAQDDKLQDYIDKKDAELDALIQEYEMKLATLEMAETIGGTGDLFSTFANIATGISGMTGSFRHIALAVKDVFAFFPVEINTLLFAGFVACIVIAIYKKL